MGLLDILTGSAGGDVLAVIARLLGITDSAALEAVKQIAPALGKGLHNNISEPGGLEALVEALKSGNHSQYIEHPEHLADQEAVEDGNAILGHILGNKDVSRNVAGYAAEQTGENADLLKRMLPMVAAATMGGLGREVAEVATGQTDLEGLVAGLIDSDDDGTDLDDLLSLAKKFF